MFGVTREKWEILSYFSNWLSALGTIGAVVVALYLARASNKARAEVFAKHVLIIGMGDAGSPPKYVNFRVVNTGDKMIRLTQIVWRVGMFRRRYAVQTFQATNISNQLPVNLEHGEEANLYIRTDIEDDAWPEYFVTTFLRSKALWFTCKSLRVQFVTSVGDVFTTKPSKELIDVLLAAGKLTKK